MSGMIKVRLVGPVKVGARWLKAGDEDVTAEELAVLEAEGLVEGPPAAAAQPNQADGRIFTGAEWEAAVRAEALTLAGQAFDGELGRLEAEVKAIVAQAEAEAVALLDRATSAEAERDQLKARIAELEAKTNPPAPADGAGAADGSSTSSPGGTVAPATPDTPPEQKPAKTTRTGAAAKKG